MAADKVKLKKGGYKVVVYPKVKSFIESLLEATDTKSTLSTRLIQKHIPWGTAMMELDRIKQREGLQALMPYMIDLK